MCFPDRKRGFRKPFGKEKIIRLKVRDENGLKLIAGQALVFDSGHVDFEGSCGMAVFYLDFTLSDP